MLIISPIALPADPILALAAILAAAVAVAVAIGADAGRVNGCRDQGLARRNHPEATRAMIAVGRPTKRF